MTSENIDNTFWRKLILVLLPLFILGVVNAAIMYSNQNNMKEQIQLCQESKVSNDVLLQYIQLHKEIHIMIEKGIDHNSKEIQRLEKKIDEFIKQYLTSNTRGDSGLNIKQDDLYQFYVDSGVNPLHVR